ncbi:group II intron reverse transcriptase/maturase, partial [Cupriavidus sp. L7L]
SRYFPTDRSRQWNFATTSAAEGKTFGLELFRASTVAIIRHVKIRASANPFDPEWTEYFARRRTLKRFARLPGASPWR